MVCYCVGLIGSSDSKFMTCSVISFWIFVMKFRFCIESLLRSSKICYVVVAMFFLPLRWFTHEKFWKTLCCCCNILFISMLNHSWEVLKDVILFLKCSFYLCVDSLLRSYERRYVVATMFFLLLCWFTPEKF